MGSCELVLTVRIETSAHADRLICQPCFAQHILLMTKVKIETFKEPKVR
jgi:hypothetical protein